MEHDLPKDVAHLVDFLILHGFDLVKRTTSKNFGNTNVVLAKSNILVSIYSDRTIWNIIIKDQCYRENKTYSVSLLNHLIDNNCDDVMTISDQVKFVASNLDFICNIFSQNNSFASHRRLALLKKERVKRRFPNLRFTQT